MKPPWRWPSVPPPLLDAASFLIFSPSQEDDIIIYIDIDNKYQVRFR